MKKWLAYMGAVTVIFTCNPCLANPKLEKILKDASLKREEAKTLAVQAPCAKDSECRLLPLRETERSCPHRFTEDDYVVYSVLSETASQLEAVVNKYNILAAKARDIQNEKNKDMICLAVAYPYPQAVCDTKKCQAKEVN